MLWSLVGLTLPAVREQRVGGGFGPGSRAHPCCGCDQGATVALQAMEEVCHGGGMSLGVSAPHPGAAGPQPTGLSLGHLRGTQLPLLPSGLHVLVLCGSFLWPSPAPTADQTFTPGACVF